MKFPVSPQHQTALEALMHRLGVKESDLEERFIRASGPGGQNVNKVSTCVVLRHRPSGLEVRCQRERSQALNRFLARRILLKRLEAERLGRLSEEAQRIAKIRRQKRRRSKRAKEKLLQFKHHRSMKKRLRGSTLWGAVLCLAVLLPAHHGLRGEEEPFLHHARFSDDQTYHLYLPQSYSQERSWPLFICIHGGYASGIGDFMMWKNYADQEGFILLAPNMPEGYHELQGGSDTILLTIVDELREAYRIDPKKILLSGFSRGGQFAWRFAMAHPEFVHTVVIFNSGNFPPPSPARGSHPPQFYLACGSEETLYADQLEGHGRALKAAGYEVKTYLARGVGHSIPPGSISDVLELFRAMRREPL